MQQRANSTSRAWAPSFHNQWRNSLCTQQHLESRTEKKNNCKTEVFLHPGLLRPLMRTSLLNLFTHIYRSRLLHVYFKAHVDPILNIFNRKLLLYVQWSILTLNKISVGHVLRFAGRLGISVAYVWYPPDKGFWKIDPIYANNLPNFQFWGMLETLLYIYYLLSISITWYIQSRSWPWFLITWLPEIDLSAIDKTLTDFK